MRVSQFDTHSSAAHLERFTLSHLDDFQPTPIPSTNGSANGAGNEAELLEMRAAMKAPDPEFDKVLETIVEKPNYRLNEQSKQLMYARVVADDHPVFDQPTTKLGTPNLWREYSDLASNNVIRHEARRLNYPLKSRHRRSAGAEARGELETFARWFPEDRPVVYAFDDGTALDIDGPRADIELSDYVLADGVLPASYEDSDLPLYHRWLDHYEGDKADLERILAYLVFTNNPMRRIFLFWGETVTGKSTVLEILTELMKGQVDTWSENKSDDTFRFANLQHSRLLIWDEVGEDPEKFPLNEFKQLSGKSTVDVRAAYKDATAYKWHGNIVLVSNYNSGIPTHDPALLDRLCTLWFTRTIPEEDRIPDIGQTIVATEGRALLLRLQKIAAAEIARAAEITAATGKRYEPWTDPMGEKIAAEDLNKNKTFMTKHFDIRLEPSSGCLRVVDIHRSLLDDSEQDCPNGCGLSVPKIPGAAFRMNGKLKEFLGRLYKSGKVAGEGPSVYTNLESKSGCID